MEIKQDDKGISFVNKAGVPINLTWSEFWEIYRYGRMIDTVGEVEAYLEDNKEIVGMSADEILANEKLIEDIADEVIDIRIGYESGDDIWNAAEKIKWRNKL